MKRIEVYAYEKKSEENKKIKEETLLSSAFNLFTKKGFKETSIQDIAESAGVGKGTFFYILRINMTFKIN